MSISLFVNGRPVLNADCDYSPDCALVQYIKREKFLCNITEVDKNHTNISITVFYTDVVASNLWNIHNTHKRHKAQQIAESNQHAL